MERRPDLQSALNELAEGFNTSADELPPISRISAICPSCAAFAAYRLAGHTSLSGVVLPEARAQRQLVQLACCSCNALSLVATMYVGKELRLLLLWPRIEWPSRAPEDLDDSGRQDYDEARRTLHLSPRASAVLTRRCLQHIIREKLGIEKRTLFDEVNDALQRPELSKATKEGLHHIREIGNFGAHPERDAAQTLIGVEPAEAEFALGVLELLFEDLYERPTRLAAMKAQLSNKRAGAPVS